MSNMMKSLKQRGEMNILLIPLVLAVFLIFAAAGFGYWAYSNMLDYKNNTDQKISVAVQAANQKLTTQLQNQFAQQEKSPYTTYNGPSAFGSIHVVYPKTWSAYVSADGSNSSTPVDGYFYPDVVPATDTTGTGGGTNFALRVQVIAQSYSDILQTYQAQVQTHQVNVKPFQLAKVPSVVGVEVTGQIQQQKTGTLIVLPVRDQTLEIWTEGSQFQDDFTNIILPNFSFSP